MHHWVSVIGLVLLAGTPTALAAEPEDLTANRLKHAATYLHTSAAALYGRKGASEKDFSPKLDTLWKHAEEQYEVVFGTVKKKDRLATLDRSLKSLETCTFELLAAIWGDSWREVFHPIPPKPKEPS